MHVIACTIRSVEIQGKKSIQLRTDNLILSIKISDCEAIDSITSFCEQFHAILWNQNLILPYRAAEEYYIRWDTTARREQNEEKNKHPKGTTELVFKKNSRP